MRRLINLISRKVSSLLGTAPINHINEEVTRTRSIVENIYVDEFLRTSLYQNPSYLESKKITHFHKSIFTQNGEDGIVEEIFKRIKTTNKYFVEFGVHGVKNNSSLLLIRDWGGLWIGGDKNGEKIIKDKFKQVLDKGRLKHSATWITKDNIENVFKENHVPSEFDFLSIDIDGNDYWIWKAITQYAPRVVCIEYNATFPPDISWIMEYNPSHSWDQTSYFGASLKALEILGKEKGYELIGCDFSGCNAFFIRKDQDLKMFDSPFTSENHYEPPRYFISKPSGHEQGFGAFRTNG